jgi:hypothetical protein
MKMDPWHLMSCESMRISGINYNKLLEELFISMEIIHHHVWKYELEGVGQEEEEEEYGDWSLNS